MRLPLAAVLTIIVGWGVVLAAPRPSPRQRWKHAARRETAEQMCKAQGPTCRVVVRPDAPKDFSGAGCACDPAGTVVAAPPPVAP